MKKQSQHFKSIALQDRLFNVFPWMLLLAFIAIAGLLWSAVKLYQAHAYHQHLQHHSLNDTQRFGSNRTPYAYFANAVRYGHQGKVDQAFASYALVTTNTTANDPLRKAAYFNAGNLYLTQATELLEKEGLPAWDVAGPLVALAKESYQKALRLEPDWSEAKYNYQLALRLAPTTHGMRGPQQYEDENIKQEEKPSGWPAMPGNPRGMP